MKIEAVFKTFRFPVGMAAILAGKLTRRNHLVFLGWYMTNTNREKVVKMPAEFATEFSPQNSAWYKIGERSFAVHPDNLDVHLSVGKVCADVVDGKVRFWDEYIFYPICRQAETHFSDCGCTERTWKSVPIPLPQNRFGSRIAELIGRIFDDVVVNAENNNIIISNKAFQYAGVPFTSVLEVPVKDFPEIERRVK